MPQKKNPDAAELIRAKTGRVNGHLIGLLTVMKGLPLTYSKDMQEDKEAVFDAAETLELMIAAMTGMISDMTVNESAMKKAAGSGYATATDLADWLVREAGLPFREAHHVTGRAVALAEASRVGLEKLPLEDLQKLHPAITDDVFSVLSVAEFGEEPDLIRGHCAAGSAPADPLLEKAAGQSVISQYVRTAKTRNVCASQRSRQSKADERAQDWAGCYAFLF